MSTRRVPSKDGDFDPYIRNTTAALLELGPPPGYERLGLSVAEKDQWEAFATAWTDVYPKYTNKSIRTTSITAQKNTIKDEFTAFSSLLLTRMYTMPTLTQADRDLFNLPVHEQPSKRGKINDTPIVKLEPNGVASVRIRVRTTSDATRPSIHPLADGVELRAALVEQTKIIGDPDPSDPSSSTPDTAVPTTPSEAPNVMVSKKALFDLNLGESSSGKRFYVFFRWVNLSNPVNNGDWTPVHQTMVL